MRNQDPKGQFYVDDIHLDDGYEIPIDNFYWMTPDGRKISLVMRYDDVLVIDNGEAQEVGSVSEGLRLIAEKLERIV